MGTLGWDDELLLLLMVDRKRVRSEPSDEEALLLLELSLVRGAGRGCSGSGFVGVASAEDGVAWPGIMFLSFSNNGSRMPKGEAGVAGCAAIGVLSLSPIGVLSVVIERLLTDVSILVGGLGKSRAISSFSGSGT